MKKAFLLLITALYLSCSSNGDDIDEVEIVEGPTDDGEFTFTYYSNSQLETVSNEYTYQYWANIQSGDKLVFEYQYVYNDEPMIADDEYSETVRFEVESGLTDFSYNTDDLENTKATLTRYCFCGFGWEGDKDVSPKGEIIGKKVSDSEWQIDVDVIFYGNEKRTFTAVYKLGTLN